MKMFLCLMARESAQSLGAREVDVLNRNFRESLVIAMRSESAKFCCASFS